MKLKLPLLIVYLLSGFVLKAQMSVSLSSQTNSVCNGFGCQYNGPSILINEVMIRPVNGDGSIYGSDPGTPLSQRQGEWIELYNPDVCKAVDISCFFLGNCSPEGYGFYGGGFELPAGTIVPARGFAVVRGVNAPAVPSNLLVQNGGNTVECIVTGNNSVCVGGGYRLWFPNAGGWYAFFDRNGVPQDAISWNQPENQALAGHPCNPPGNCPFTGVLDNYNTIPASRKTYIFDAAPVIGQSIRRLPDGGNWAVNSTASPTYGNCNALCAPAPIVTCVGSATVNVTGGTPPYYYQWNDGLQQVTQTAVGLCGGTYCVTVTDNTGATAMGCINVHNFTPDVYLDGLDPHVCIDQQPFTLSSGTPAGGSYQGPGTVSGVFYPALAGVGQHMIKYTYLSEDSCSNSDSAIITVHDLPTVSLAPLNDICVNEVPFLLSTGMPAGGTYQGPGVINDTLNPALTGVGTFTVNYLYTDSIGCTNSASATITVIDAPDVTFESITPVCVDHAPFQLTQGSPAGGTYSGISVTGNVFDPDAAGVGYDTITYTYLAITGCSDSAVQTILVNPLPEVIAPQLPGLCVSHPEVVLSGGLPLGGTYSGTAVSNGSFDPSLAGIGSFSIFYTYTDTNTCTNTDTSLLTIYALPVVAIDPFSPFCFNVPSVALTGGTPTGGTYSGPGVVAGNFLAGITGLGTFPITYAFSDTNGCVDSITTTLTVYCIPEVGLSPLDPVCKGIPAFPLSGGTPPGGTYSGVGVNNGYFNPVFASTYTITYSFQDINGCVNDTSQLLIVMDKPIISLPLFPDLCINGQPLALQGEDPPGGFYSGPGVTGNLFNPSSTGAGTFIVTYTYENIAHCIDSAHQNITVHPLPLVSFGSINGICIGNNGIMLTSGTPSGGSYSGPGVNNGYFSSDSSGVGTFTLYYTYTDTYGCSDSAIQTVTVYPLPLLFNITGGGINCQDVGSPVGLDGSEIGVEYRLLADGVIQGFPFTGTGTSFSFNNQYVNGVFTIKAQNLSTTCENTMSDSVVIALIPLPDPDLPDSLFLCEVPAIVLEAKTFSDSLDFVWQDGSTDKYITVTEPGVYWVRVGLGECIATDTTTVYNCSKLIIPNVFTPNEDNFNDRFKPKTIGDILNYKVEIYNRWGKTVYSSTDINEGWDGTLFNEGSACSDGTYYYVITFISLTYPDARNDNKLTGSVTLLR